MTNGEQFGVLLGVLVSQVIWVVGKWLIQRVRK